MKCSTSSPHSRIETVLTLLVAAACALAALAWPRIASAQQLAISPMTATVAPMGTQAFTASGGSGSGYTWSMAAAPSGGQISSTGDYTAGPTPNVTDQVQVTDSMLNVATATVTVSAGVTITPAGITLAPGNMQQFTAAGGTPPYSWSLVMNTSGGNITAAGLYTAGPTLGSDTVRVADSLNNSFTVPITVVAMVPLGSVCTTAGTCPVTSDGNAYCVDGVCCSGACTGQCQACNTANSLGTCVTISGPAVAPRPACPMSDSSNVCSAKVCDGKNPTSCDVFVGATTTCGAATCIDLVGTPQAVCQGDGTCQKVTQQSCAPFACVSDQCATSCTNDSECSPGNYCNVTSGKCVVGPGGVGGGSGDASAASASGSPESSSGCSIEQRRSSFGPFEALLLGLVIAAGRARARRRA